MHPRFVAKHSIQPDNELQALTKGLKVTTTVSLRAVSPLHAPGHTKGSAYHRTQHLPYQELRDDRSDDVSSSDEQLGGECILPPKPVSPYISRPLTEHERNVSFSRDLAAWGKHGAFERVPASSVDSSANIIGSHTVYK